jgi:4-amino-4-deoxy-L-arabinose transferase-like glycosyltransferase
LSFAQFVAVFIAVSVLVRLVIAATVPLAFDEALYWRYSRHLAAGFLDHPFMNPLMIRAGTFVFGDTPLGVRFFAVLFGVPASWAVWRAGTTLFNNERVGATAALFLNCSLVMSAGSLLATSDQIVVVTSAFLLLALSKVGETGRGAWWLAVGAAFGLGMCAKYTTIFFAVGIIAWLSFVPQNRRWFADPWPWFGAILALAIFSPTLLWNADHGWASVVYQSKRIVVHELTLRYLGEVIASQFGLATPPIFVLGCIALFGGLNGTTASARTLLASLTLPIIIYFVWHSLHQRVQGNWPEAMYPAVAVAAAFTSFQLQGQAGALGTAARWATASAAPLGIVLAAAIYTQAVFGLLPLGASDPTARMLGVGWPVLAAQIDDVRLREGAPVIVGTEYQVVSWLTFYLPSHSPVVQLTQRIRWANEPAPEAFLFNGPVLFVCKNECPKLAQIKQKFAVVQPIVRLARKRRTIVIEHYSLYRLAAPTGPVLDPLYAELTNGQLQ